MGRDPIICKHCAQTTFTGKPKGIITISDGVSFEEIHVFRCRICGGDTKVRVKDEKASQNQ